MKHTRVVSYKNLPARMPITSFLVLFLLMDRYHASGWQWGCAATITGIIIIVTIVGYFQEDGVDIFKEKL